MDSTKKPVRMEVCPDSQTSAATSGTADLISMSDNLTAGGLSERDKSPEAIVAKLFGKTESDLAMIEKSMRIAQNVVLGPSTSPKGSETSTSRVCVGEESSSHASRAENEVLIPITSAKGNETSTLQECVGEESSSHASRAENEVHCPVTAPRGIETSTSHVCVGQESSSHTSGAENEALYPKTSAKGSETSTSRECIGEESSSHGSRVENEALCAVTSRDGTETSMSRECVGGESSSHASRAENVVLCPVTSPKESETSTPRICVGEELSSHAFRAENEVHCPVTSPEEAETSISHVCVGEESSSHATRAENETLCPITSPEGTETSMLHVRVGEESSPSPTKSLVPKKLILGNPNDYMINASALASKLMMKAVLVPQEQRNDERIHVTEDADSHRVSSQEESVSIQQDSDTSCSISNQKETNQAKDIYIQKDNSEATNMQKDSNQKDTNQANDIHIQKDNPVGTQKDSCHDQGSKIHIHSPTHSTDTEKDQQDHSSGFQNTRTEVPKGDSEITSSVVDQSTPPQVNSQTTEGRTAVELSDTVNSSVSTATPSEKSESENVSILSVLSHMAAEAGTENVDTAVSSISPIAQPVLVNQKTSFPEIASDDIPVTSNISFDYSIASLISGENSTSKSDDDSPMSCERENNSSPPITKQVSSTLSSTLKGSDPSTATTNLAAKQPPVWTPSEISSSVVSSTQEMSNTGENMSSAVQTQTNVLSSEHNVNPVVSVTEHNASNTSNFNVCLMAKPQQETIQPWFSGQHRASSESSVGQSAASEVAMNLPTLTSLTMQNSSSSVSLSSQNGPSTAVSGQTFNMLSETQAHLPSTAQQSVSSNAPSIQSSQFTTTGTTTKNSSSISSLQQQSSTPHQAFQPVANSVAPLHGASISNTPMGNGSQKTTFGSSGYNMSELNLPDFEFELSSILSQNIQQPAMSTPNNFNAAQPAPAPMLTHHGAATQYAQHATISQQSAVARTGPSPTLSRQSPFTQPLQSPTLPSPAQSPHSSSGSPHGGMMAPPQIPQQNFNMLARMQDHVGFGQPNTDMPFAHSQQPPLSNSMNIAPNQYHGHSTHPNDQSIYNSNPREVVHWQGNQTNTWQRPQGIGMQGREQYGQFNQFQVRPQRQQFNPMPHGQPNIPNNVGEINMRMQGQFPNVSMQTNVGMQTSMSNDNMNMELTRFAMAELQKQSMQSNMNSAMYQRPQIQAQSVQRPPVPQNPRASAPVNHPQRGIPLVSFANRGMSNHTRPTYGQSSNSARTGHAPNIISKSSGQMPPQRNLPPISRVLGAPQVRHQQYSQSAHPVTNPSPLQSTQRPQFYTPQTAKRMPFAVPPVSTPNTELSTIRSIIQKVPKPVSSAISSRTSSSAPRESSDKSKSSTPSTTLNSDTNSLAALVVESVLKGQNTNCVEQQIRLVNELMTGKSTTSATQQSTPLRQGDSTSQKRGVEPTNSSSSTPSPSPRAETVPQLQTPPPPRPSSQTNVGQTTPPRKKPGRPQEMFVDLTADENEPTAAPTIPKPKPKKPDRENDDIHILIEVVNTKSQVAQFCILERCLRLECKPKYLPRCSATHNWWVYQSEKKLLCPKNEDVAYIAAQIIARSQHDKVYFRQQMTAILHSEDFKRAKIFQTLCTERVHVLGRSFHRPKAKAGILFLNALKDFPPGGSTEVYLSMTASSRITQQVAKLTEEEEPRKEEPRVLVIEPIADSSPVVQVEPEMPPDQPQRPLSAQERHHLENQQPIVIEPPPTPAANICYADEDVPPLVIAPEVPSQSDSNIRQQSQIDQQHVSNTDLLNQVPLVIAPPPTPRAPSPNDVQRESAAAPNINHGGQFNASRPQMHGIMQPPSQKQIPGRTQASSESQGPQVPSGASSHMPQSLAEVLNSPVASYDQSQLMQHQARLQMNIQKELQAQHRLNQQQQQQARQQAQMQRDSAFAQLQFLAMQRMRLMSQAGAVIRPPFLSNIAEQGRPVGTQSVLQGLVPQPTPFGVGAPSPIILSQNPGVHVSNLNAEQQNRIPVSSTPARNKPGNLPAELPSRPTSGSKEQQVTQNKTPVAPETRTTQKQTSKDINSKTNPQQEKRDALGDGSKGREFITLEDFITMSTDNGREVCASVGSSLDDDKKETETPFTEHLKTILLENGQTEKEYRGREKQRVRIQLRRIEDVYDSLGLKRLSKTRFRIKTTSTLMKPKRATVRRKFAIDDGVDLEDADDDPVWEDASSEDSPSSDNSSTDEYSEDEEDREDKKPIRRLKRPFSTSSDEDEVGNCDVYDSGAESPRKAADSTSPQRKRRRIKQQEDSDVDAETSPMKRMNSDGSTRSPGKSRKRKRRVIDSDDEPPDSPFRKADPVFLPSPSKNRPPRVLTPSKHKSTRNCQSDSGTDTKSVSDITRDVEALRKLCPSLQPVVRIVRLTTEQICRYTKRKAKSERMTTKEPPVKKSVIKRNQKRSPRKEQPKHVGNKQTRASRKVTNSSCHDSGSDTEPCETESSENTQPADSDSGVPPARGLESLPVEYDLEYFTNEQLWDELQRRQNFTSCVCGMTFIDLKHYNLHRDLHDKVNPKKCAICCEVFPDWIEFTSHTYSSHKAV